MIELLKILLTTITNTKNEPKVRLYKKEEKSFTQKIIGKLNLTPRQQTILLIFFMVLLAILFVALCYALIPSATESGLTYNQYGIT